MTDLETLRIERRGDIATMTPCRPEVLDRVDQLAHRELVLGFRELQEMPISLANEPTSLGSDDLREAIAAFKERRTPTYAGR